MTTKIANTAKEEAPKLTPEEELKILKATLSSLNTQLGTLERQNLRLAEIKQVAKGLISKFMTACPKCGKNPIRIDWNEQTYILTCDTQGCGHYRQPNITILKKDIALFS